MIVAADALLHLMVIGLTASTFATLTDSTKNRGTPPQKASSTPDEVATLGKDSFTHEPSASPTC